MTAQRNEKGQFLAGSSGNPVGRPVGARDRIVQQKLALEAAVRENVSSQEISAILNVMADAAKNGNVAAGKYILDKFISNAKVEEEVDMGDKGITVVVKNATFQVVGDEPEALEGEIVTDQEEI